jgi:hypothetical protein
MQQTRTDLARERDAAVAELSSLGWDPQPKTQPIDLRLAAVEDTSHDHGRRISSIERRIYPSRVVTFWRVCAVLSLLAGLTAAAKWPQVLFELYLPIGLIVEAAFIGLAVVCVLQANAQLEREK